MPREFFGQYDLLGDPRYDDIHGHISIRSTKYIVHQINHVDDSVDLVFHGLDGINELIYQLTRLRDSMVEKVMGCTIQLPKKGE